MNAYWAVFSGRFRTILQYRAAALAGLGTQVFWGFIRIGIYSAFYATAAGEQPLTFDEVVSYLWLTQALLLLLPWRPDPEVETLVQSGNVAYELLRPIDLYSLWYARSLAQRSAPALLRCIPLVVLAGSFWGLQPPPTWQAGLAFAISLAAAIALSAAMTTALSVALLYTTSGRGIHVLTTSLVNAFSGTLVPLPLFPPVLGMVAAALPFRGLMDTPFLLYLGRDLDQAGAMIGHQIGWTVALVLLGRWLLARALRRMVVQGG